MLLTINNEKKFYRNLFLYKSFLCRFVYFETDIASLQKLCTCLNIKKRKKRLTYIYNTALQQIDNFYQNKNMCCFINNKCLTQRNNNLCNGCCRKCRYQTNGPCQLDCLACKMFYCGKAKAHKKYLTYQDLTILKCLRSLERILLKDDYFSKKEDVINDLYWGFMIGSFRLFFRIIINALLIKKNKL